MISKYAVPISLLILLPAAAWLLGSYSGGLLTQFAALGLATAALAMCWGFAGILSLGHAVSFAVGAYAYAWCSLNIEGVGQVLGFVVGVVIGVLLSGLIGLIGLRGQVDQVSFSLFTLVILFVAAQLVVAMPRSPEDSMGSADCPPSAWVGSAFLLNSVVPFSRWSQCWSSS